MYQIRKIGKFFAKDDSGYFINECRGANIIPPWDKAVQAVMDAYLCHHSQHLQSVYLRGSLPQGTAISGFSDIDTIGIFHDDAKDIDFSWISSFRKQFLIDFPEASELELFFLKKSELLESVDKYNFRFVVKCASLCIFGENLQQQIRPFRPSLKLAVSFHGNIDSEIRRTLKNLGKPLKSSDYRKLCQWICKRILRTGMAMHMVETQDFTRDLYLCWEIFSKYHPAESSRMRKALEWAVNPIDDPGELTKFLNDFGNWLAANAERIFYSLQR